MATTTLNIVQRLAVLGDDADGSISGVEDALCRFDRRDVENLHALVHGARRPAFAPARLNLATAESVAEGIGSNLLIENLPWSRDGQVNIRRLVVTNPM